MILDHFTRQANGCRRMGSELYARLLTAAGNDLAAGGPVATVIAGWESSTFEHAVPLRLMGGVHRLVLGGSAPDLAAHYPSVGGTPGSGVEQAFLDTVAANRGDLIAAMEDPPQTNEVNRSGLLLAGLMAAASHLGPELRLLEVGSSAGLNLLLDRYRYDLGIGSWGPPSPVLVATEWLGLTAVPEIPFTIVERRGCDANPLDVADPEAMLRLRSFVWSDQVERLARLDAAIRVAHAHPPRVDRALAQGWLAQQLAAPGPPPVFVHSFVLQYLDAEARGAIIAAYDRFDGPKARLGIEFGDAGAEVALQVSPDDVHLVVGHCHAHGRWLEFSPEGRAALS